jgi:hypothetical protein
VVHDDRADDLQSHDDIAVIERERWAEITRRVRLSPDGLKRRKSVSEVARHFGTKQRTKTRFLRLRRRRAFAEARFCTHDAEFFRINFNPLNEARSWSRL